MRQADQDPYLGLRNLMRQTARGQLPQGLTVGRVLTVEPVSVLANGLELGPEDLKIPARLLPDWNMDLYGLSWPTGTLLPEAIFSGTCEVEIPTGPNPEDIQVVTGTAAVTRPRELAKGQTAAAASARIYKCGLKIGDEVLLLPAEDGQIYYLIDKFVQEVVL